MSPRRLSLATLWAGGISAAAALAPGVAVQPARAADAGATPPVELVRQVDYEPFWSPDGGSFVFVSNRNGPMNLYRATAKGELVARLTSHPGPDDTPAWSPDGRWIAFVSDVDGNSEIYLVGADGSGLRRLTSHPAPDLHPTWEAGSRDRKSVV